MKAIQILFFILLSFISLYAQSGGQFVITQSVTAGGGVSSSCGNFKVEGTTGQNLASTLSAGTGFNVRGGFWSSNLAPTAASGIISGRILTSEGLGIRNVRITLTNAITGETFYAISSSLGYYSFGEVPVGQIYILSVSAKRFVFNPDSRLISLSADLTDEDFTAMGN